MSNDNKRAEFEIALEYNPAAAQKAKADLEELEKRLGKLGKQTTKVGEVKVQSRGTGITPAERELKALAMVSRTREKEEKAVEARWEKNVKARDAAEKREANRIEQEERRRAKENNALKAGEGMVVERLNKQQERDRKAAEREVAAQIKKTKTDIAKLSKQEAKDQDRARSQAHREEIKAANESERISRQAIAKASREKAAIERRTLQHEKEIERIKARSEKAEWRHNLRMQQRRDRMRSQGFSEGASMARSGGMRLGAGAIAAGTLGVQAHLAMSKGVGEIMTLKPGFDEAEAKAMIKGGVSSYGGETTTTAKAIYDIASSGFGEKKADTQAVFDAASKLAVGGVTDVATAADGLTSALNAWNLGADKAGFVTDQFFQSAKDGKTTIEQLSQNIGTVAPTAAAFGVSLEEVMAVFGEVTKKGVKTETAASGLRQMIKSIVNPTKQAKDAAAAMGIKVGSDAIAKAGGLDKWLEKLLTSKRYKDSRMQAIFSDMDGQSIVNALRALGPQGLIDAKQRQVGAAGSTDDAFNTMMATDHMRAQKIMGEVRVALVEFGEAIMPLVRDAMPHVTAGLQDLRKWLEKEENRNLVISATKVALMLGGVAAVGGPLSKLIGMLNLLTAGALASGAKNLVSGIGGAAGAMGPLGVAIGVLTGAVLLGAQDAKAAAEEMKLFGERMAAVRKQSDDWEDMEEDHIEPLRKATGEAQRKFDDHKKSANLWRDIGETSFRIARDWLPTYVTTISPDDLTTTESNEIALHTVSVALTNALKDNVAFSRDLSLTVDERWNQGGVDAMLRRDRTAGIQAASIIREKFDHGYQPRYLNQSAESIHREYETMSGQSREFHRASQSPGLWFPPTPHVSSVQSLQRDRVEVVVELKGEEAMRKMARVEAKKVNYEQARNMALAPMMITP